MLLDDARHALLLLLSDMRGMFTRDSVMMRRKYGHYCQQRVAPVLCFTNYDLSLVSPHARRTSKWMSLKNSSVAPPPHSVQDMAVVLRHWIVNEAAGNNLLLTSPLATSDTSRLTEESRKRWNYKSHQDLDWPKLELSKTTKMWGLAMVDHPIAAQELRKMGMCTGR